MVSFADAVRTVLERHDITQAQLADALSVSRQTVSGWANGHREPHAFMEGVVRGLCDDPISASRYLDRYTGDPRAWSAREDAAMIRAREAGMSWREVAEEVGRSKGSCKTRMRLLRRDGVV